MNIREKLTELGKLQDAYKLSLQKDYIWEESEVEYTKAFESLVAEIEGMEKDNKMYRSQINKAIDMIIEDMRKLQTIKDQCEHNWIKKPFNMIYCGKCALSKSTNTPPSNKEKG